MNKCDIFIIFAQNIDCGYTLQVVLLSTHNLCFRAKKIGKNVYPCKPQFHYIKVGCKGVCLHDEKHLQLLFLWKSESVMKILLNITCRWLGNKTS